MKSIAQDLEKGDVAQAVSTLTAARSTMDIILASLRPLIELMFPSEYYKFRKNLGETSGSQSEGLGAKVLGTAYVAMCDTYVHHRIRHSGTSEEYTALDLAFFAFRHRIYRWRDQHMLLPRNVLGTGTTSLMGSRDAPDAARRMSRSFERKDPLSAIPGHTEVRSDWPELHEGEKKLLMVTGQLTKEVFEGIERRRHRPSN